jgi:hypothetical protein
LPGGLVLASSSPLLPSLVSGDITGSATLKALEERDVMRFYEQHLPHCEYFLTKKGEVLRSILMALRHWGEAYT